MSVLRTSLTGQQREVEERLRTVCLLLCGLAVVAAGLYYLKAILIPLVLAVSLMYILQPLIDFLTRRPLLCCGRRCCVQRPNLDGVPACLRPVAESCLLVRLPYWLAVCVALVVACAVIAFFGFVVADSVRTFSSKATEYTARVQLLARTLVSWLDDMQISWQHYMTSPRGSLAHANATAAAPLIDPARIEELAKKVPVGDMILSVLTSLVDVPPASPLRATVGGRGSRRAPREQVLSNLFLVLLFTVYLLLGSSPNHDAPGFGRLDDNERPAHDAGASSSCASSRVAPAPPERRNSAFGVSTSAHGDAAIRSYLKSKIGVSILVGLATAVSLAALGVDLWLVFGVATPLNPSSLCSCAATPHATPPARIADSPSSPAPRDSPQPPHPPRPRAQACSASGSTSCPRLARWSRCCSPCRSCCSTSDSGRCKSSSLWQSSPARCAATPPLRPP